MAVLSPRIPHVRLSRDQPEELLMCGTSNDDEQGAVFHWQSGGSNYCYCGAAAAAAAAREVVGFGRGGKDCPFLVVQGQGHPRDAVRRRYLGLYLMMYCTYSTFRKYVTTVHLFVMIS